MAQYDVDVDWPRAFWIGFGVILAATLLFVLYTFIGTFVFGIFLYYATRPLYRRVYRRVRQRTIAAMLSLFLLAFPVIILLYYTIAIALQEFDRFADTADIGPYASFVEPYLDVSDHVQNPQALLSDAAGPGAIVDTLGQFVNYLGFVGTGLVHGFVMFAVAFYLLRDGPRLAEWAKNFLDHRGVLDRYFHEVDRSFHKVFYGNILNAIVTGAIGAISFSLVDVVAPAGASVPYPALIGLLAGAASLIPIIGMKIVYVPMAAYLGIQAALGGGEWWFVALFTGVAFVVVDTIPDLLVRPYVSSGKSFSIGRFGARDTEETAAAGLHTGTLMFAYILGPFLFGWYGIFLAPMLLVFVVQFARFVLPELIEGEPVRPRAVDPTNLIGEEVGDPETDAQIDAENETTASEPTSESPSPPGSDDPEVG
ncbi:AI-2E family transporter [Haloarcula pellucida]|uniref:AI-2E family transporter n=1 Tax=Haloarcula pellucida TaxID=1427151 RepID=A0A830GKC2_9EURY|nr:AI-2E family transporter [Halomicroarcula pellucida]MBX0347688.1 AI-2E family transporter [Halomicroarcula pellucida]GGN89871.1 AI-2E family transporter [Halomicroarcula pellucida]